jgi:Flp pilus assembly protein TadD
VAREAEGDLSAAQQHVTTALKLDPQSAGAQGLLGKILFKQGKAAEAVKLVESGVQGRPTDQELRYLLARIYQQLGRKEDAAREFAEVQKLKAEKLKQDRANTPKP